MQHSFPETVRYTRKLPLQFLLEQLDLLPWFFCCRLQQANLLNLKQNSEILKGKRVSAVHANTQVLYPLCVLLHWWGGFPAFNSSSGHKNVFISSLNGKMYCFMMILGCDTAGELGCQTVSSVCVCLGVCVCGGGVYGWIGGSLDTSAT